MKKTICILLTLALMLSLGTAALAADKPAVVKSPQKLIADGETIQCEVYNIDGSNYFKLRDIAALVNGSDSQFSIGWDAEAGVISVRTGEPYVAFGSELSTGTDKSATAVKSAQTLIIDGTERSDLSVFNIGGNNYFKLRDMSAALNFDVDFDAATNTAFVKSHGTKLFTRGFLCTGSEYTTVFKPDDIRDTCTYRYTFNDARQMTESVMNDGMDIQSSKYSYDDNGRLIRRESGNTVVEYAYNEAGDPVSEVLKDNGVVYSTEITNYDQQGRISSVEHETAAGDGSESTVYAYNADGTMTQTWRSGSSTETTVFTYDDAGRIVGRVFTSETPLEVRTTETRMEYDSRGNLTCKTLKEADPRCGNQVTTENYANTYDENGKLIRTEFTGTVYRDGTGTEITEPVTIPIAAVTTEYSYDSYGNLLTLTETKADSVVTEVHTYDYVNGTETFVRTEVIGAA